MRPLVHAAAAVFAVAVTAYALLGAVSGLVRPTFSLDPEGVAAGPGAPFGFWIALVGLVCVTAAACALTAYRVYPRARGVAMLVWTALVALVGTRVFAATGDLVAVWTADPPQRMPAAVTLGAVSFVAAAFCAAIFYWCAGLVELEPESKNPEGAKDEARGSARAARGPAGAARGSDGSEGSDGYDRPEG